MARDLSLYIFPNNEGGWASTQTFRAWQSPHRASAAGAQDLNPAVVLSDGPIVNWTFSQFNVGFVILEVLDRDFI